MRHFLIFLLSVLVLGCSPDRKNQAEERFPCILLQDFPFVLGLRTLDTYEDLEDLYIHADSSIDINKTAFEYSRIKIEYHYSLNGRTVENDTFTLKADNNEYFTIGELIYKINKKTYSNLSDYDHKYLEGLEYIGMDDNIPIYRIAQGS